MEEWKEVANVNDFQPGTLKAITVDGHEYLIARIGDQYYAADNRCPHMGGNLSHGKLEGTVITCPRHKSQFDLKDGHVIRWTIWPAALVALDQVRSRKRDLPIYDVTVKGDKILLAGSKVLAAR